MMGSTDNTGLLEEEFSGRIRYYYQENSGVSKARNTGITMSSGPILTFLDSDDTWMPDKLEQHLQFINTHKNIKIHQTEDIWIRNGKRVNPGLRHKKVEGTIFLESLELCLISPSSVAIDRSLFNRYGLFDEALVACEDYDLWLRITLFEEVGLIHKPCITRYGGHDDQLSSAYWGMDRFRVYSICKVLHKNGETMIDPFRERARSVALKKLEILYSGAVKRDKSDFINTIQNVINQLQNEDYNSTDYQNLLAE
jgi:glycosyltransferase involved in cell wall biosynthesis